MYLFHAPAIAVQEGCRAETLPLACICNHAKARYSDLQSIKRTLLEEHTRRVTLQLRTTTDCFQLKAVALSIALSLPVI
jgi:hypothetical protein